MRSTVSLQKCDQHSRAATGKHKGGRNAHVCWDVWLHGEGFHSSLKSPSLSTTMGISAPLKGCFEELYLNKDIRYVAQITCYKYILPKPPVCSPNEINVFFSHVYFQRCTLGVFRHTESWAHKSAGRPDTEQQGLCSAPQHWHQQLFCLTQGSSVCLWEKRIKGWPKKPVNLFVTISRKQW